MSLNIYIVGAPLSGGVGLGQHLEGATTKQHRQPPARCSGATRATNVAQSKLAICREQQPKRIPTGAALRHGRGHGRESESESNSYFDLTWVFLQCIHRDAMQAKVGVAVAGFTKFPL